MTTTPVHPRLAVPTPRSGAAPLALPEGADEASRARVRRLRHVVGGLEADHGPLRPLRTYAADPAVLVGADVVLHVASAAEGRAALRHEVACRAWAAAAGVPVPQVVALGGDVLVSARVPTDEPDGVAYAAAAAVAAGALAAAATPPPDGGRSWRAPRRTLPARVVRGLLSPLHLREFRAVRARVAALPVDGHAHGDFRTNNVLSDAAGGLVRVVDWEYAGPAWTGTDLLTLAADAVDDATADALVHAAVELRGATERADVGTVLLWQASRALAERATGVRLGRRDPAQLAESARLVARARRTAALLGAPRA